MTSQLDKVAKLFDQAENILFVTGAGLSADSGLPTYRGVGGLYDVKETEEGIPIESALSGMMLAARPDVTWKYLWQIGAACRGAKPNRGHEVMAAFEQHRPNTWVLTQNVDGLHHSAGQKNLIEIHGRADELFCTKCGQRTTAAQLIQNYGGSVVLPPQCASCSGLVRPNVVLFGEMLPGQAVRTMERIFSGPLHLVVMVGTSAQFPYITEPVRIARARAIPSVEINPGDTPISGLVDFKLTGGAAETLDKLWGMTFGR